MSPNTYYDIVDEAGRLALTNDSKVKQYIFSGDIIISNGSTELADQAAYDWISLQEKVNTDGRRIIHDTPRFLGTYTYFTGSDDDHTDPHKVGGSSNITDLYWNHSVGGSNPEVIYMDFNCIINKTYIRQGDLMWENAKQDYLVFEIVPKVTSYTTSTNTNFNLYDGYLIIPAAGDGTISVDAEDMVLVQNTPNEHGDYPAGYWDADWNTTTKQFENITANPLGTGKYNMFGLEVPLFRFMNRRRLLGTGRKDCMTNDTSQLGHNMRLKISAYTEGDDHEWSGNATIMMYRNRTV
jgi:hypothetical protein